MQVNRKEFLALLNRASIGLTPRDVLEQSGSFVFDDGLLVTYNEDVCFRGKTPLRGKFAIPADDFVRLLSKFDDEELEIDLKGDQIRIKGGGKVAGLSCFQEITLPFQDVPRGGDWHPLKKGVFQVLQQAARTCGRDYTRPQTTTVNVGPKIIQGFDNHRLLRAVMKTGFTAEVCVPAAALMGMAQMTIVSVDVGKGWAHFLAENGEEISVHCIYEKYIEGLEKIPELDHPKKIRLPSNMAESVVRAGIMTEDGYDSRLHVEISEGRLILKAQKGSGWYRESRRVSYDGPALAFDVHPEVFADIVALAREALVTADRMKIEQDSVCYVIALMKATETAEE